MDVATRRGWLALVALVLAIFASTLPPAQALETFKCRVPRVIVTTESGGSGLSASEVEVLIGRNPNFVDPSSTHWTCTDGIAGEEALSTPGGDSGEFLMGLALYAAEMKKFYPDFELSKHEVHEMFKEFLGSIDESRSFYMHMDANVYKLLQEKLVPILGANPNIYYVPETKQEQVLKYLTDPDYVGCSHLHAIMMFPSKYSIPRDTVTYFLSSFYEYMWNHESSDKLVLAITDAVPIDGSRTEMAYIKLGTEQAALDLADQCKNMAPVVSAKTAKGSVFLAQPQFVGGVRDSIVFFFSRKLQSLIGEQDVSEVNIVEQMAELAATHLQLSITNLAKGKPVYKVTMLLDNTSSLLRLIIASVVSILLFILLFASITYIKFRQLIHEDDDHEV